MLIEGALVFNAYRRRFEEKSVLVHGPTIAAVVPPGVLRAENGDSVVDARGAYLAPGLVDVHMHIESSMTSPSEFARAVLPLGTTTVVAEPHEIANVFGLEGIRAFMAEKTELDIFYGIPSSVPSAGPGLETSGGSIGPDEVEALAADPRVLCLGEVMRARELSDPGMNCAKASLERFRRARPFSPIEGHCPVLRGLELQAFVAAGVWSDHTKQSPESIREKVDAGMFIELQRKSIDEDNVAAIVEDGLFEQLCIVTDDVLPDRLIERGHLGSNVALAVRCGMRPEDALYCATYVPARHMGLRDRGAIAPGRIADLIMLDDLESFAPRAVYKAGRLVEAANARRSSASVPSFPKPFYESIKREPLSVRDFEARAPISEGEIDCATIRVSPDATATRRGSARLLVRRGRALWREAGLSLAAVVERYGRGEPIRPAFLEGTLSAELDEGAVATSWSHDSHNILVAGRSESDMATAANAVIAMQGGYAVARGGRVVASARLRVGGIVSEAPIEDLARDVREVREAMRGLGYKHYDEIMSFSTLALLASPSLKLSDKGLVDTVSQRLVEVYELPHP